MFSSLNLFVVLPIFFIPGLILDAKITAATDFNYPTELQFLAQMLFCVAIEDLGFYCSHAALHYPFLYSRVHKYHHENKVTVSTAVIHTHPIEFIFANAVPQLAGSILLGKRIHYTSYLGFNILRIVKTLDAHCGYRFSWSMPRLIPFHLHGQEHAYHHSDNVGSYGSFLDVWDTVFGTNGQFYRDLKSLTNTQKSD